MSAALTLAKSQHLERLAALCSDFHDEAGIMQTDAGRHAALHPLLDGSPYGAVYLIGPERSPIGYIAVCFGWSIEFGGLDAIVDELYIRPGVRGRGIATEALIALPKALASGGLRAVHLEVDRAHTAAISLYQRAGFAPREKYMFMSRQL
ncbi:MAG: GNAT family N-acetyltransferase [Pseudomonadota bacterium]